LIAAKRENLRDKPVASVSLLRADTYVLVLTRQFSVRLIPKQSVAPRKPEYGLSPSYLCAHVSHSNHA
jgi:hypothetical protein